MHLVTSCVKVCTPMLAPHCARSTEQRPCWHSQESHQCGDGDTAYGSHISSFDEWVIPTEREGTEDERTPLSSSFEISQ
ncbi:hypothetical protein PsYK624_027450 [Phanerochaete sordida]|uniref:Uncharacterized protein n=1 Tax=Phanerochaete sordida TaxID=48140 RepID=A0A9P3L9L7_9APHY|nr:hypothetical protein PsYK624_027450 [Phanerochaete sordida]